MTLIQQFTEELEREAPRTRRVLLEVPHDRDDWKPHAKSMPLGRLAGLVASMPSWVNLILEKDELNLTPRPGAGQYHAPKTSELVVAHDTMVAAARDALSRTNNHHLLHTNWKLIAGGRTVGDDKRYVVLRDTFNHLVHHRGQLTVYLRLCDRKVPSVYGPSADDPEFR